MKRRMALISALLFLLACFKVSAGGGQNAAAPSNYVVIGAFSIPKNAIEFTELARKNKFEATYSINPLRKLFYVYVLETGDFNAACEQAKKLRQETSYSDTWVFTGRLGEETVKGDDINPETGKEIKTVAVDTKTETPKETASTNTTATTTTPASTPSTFTTPETTSTPSSTPVTEQPTQPLSQLEEAPEGSKAFLFKIYTGENKEISGDVDVMDLERGKRKMASYRGNETVHIKPVNKSGSIELDCEVFGYRKIQLPLNFNEPQATDGITLDNGKVVVPFSLVRLKKGDIAIMYNVYFFKDAAIMRPESRYEVNSLLDMLKENMNYKIRIHGHTNGNASGKIISTKDPKNFFTLRDTEQGHGSAKKLSEERAAIIQNYLISQGIDPKRMEIKAWGGKKPIYEEDSHLAQANVRVEIEILEDGSTN